MATGDKRINIFPGKVTPYEQANDAWLLYLYNQTVDVYASLYPTSGILSGAVPGASVNNNFYVGATTGKVDDYSFADDRPHHGKVEYAGGDQIPFENANGVDYWVAMGAAFTPDFASATAIEGDPALGNAHYSVLLEQIGNVDQPDAVSDLGGSVRLEIDGALTGGAGSAPYFTQAGRTVWVYLWSDPKSLDPAVAFQELTVQWDAGGSVNYVETADYLGATGALAAAQYRVFVPTVTVSKADPGSGGDAIWICKITGNDTGGGAVPAAFDTSGQINLGFSPATITSAFQQEHTLTGGADDGRHSGMTFNTMRNRDLTEGGSVLGKPNARITLSALSAADDDNFAMAFYNSGSDIARLWTYGGQRYAAAEDDSLAEWLDTPFVNITELTQATTGQGSKVGAELLEMGLDADYFRDKMILVPWIDGGNYPGGMNCNVLDTGNVDITDSVPDLTTKDIITQLDQDGVLIARLSNTTDRDGYYLAEVVDADTISIEHLDGDSVSGWSGTQAGEVSFFIARWFSMQKADGDVLEVLQGVCSPYNNVAAVGHAVFDRPMDLGGNEYYGWGYQYYDAVRGAALSEARASGTVAAMAFASTDELPADVAGITGPNERFTGLAGVGVTAEHDDLLLFTGEESGGGWCYIGRPEEGGTWPWVTFSELAVALSPDVNVFFASIIPWDGTVTIGEVGAEWDAYINVLRALSCTGLTPDTNGRDLGTSSLRWDCYFRDVEITGVINSALRPGAAGFDLGFPLASQRWDDLYIEKIWLNTGFGTDCFPNVDSNGTTGTDVGNASWRWKKVYAWDAQFYRDVDIDRDLYVDQDAWITRDCDINRDLDVAGASILGTDDTDFIELRGRQVYDVVPYAATATALRSCGDYTYSASDARLWLNVATENYRHGMALQNAADSGSTTPITAGKTAHFSPPPTAWDLHQTAAGTSLWYNAWVGGTSESGIGKCDAVNEAYAYMPLDLMHGAYIHQIKVRGRLVTSTGSTLEARLVRWESGGSGTPSREVVAANGSGQGFGSTIGWKSLSRPGGGSNFYIRLPVDRDAYSYAIELHADQATLGDFLEGGAVWVELKYDTIVAH